MNHRKSILGCAVGASLLASSGAAFAYVPVSNTDADVVIYWGGATASSLSAQELAVAAVCDTDTNLLYVKSTSGANIDRPGNDWAVACKTAAAGVTKTGLPNDKKVLVIKRDRGGSGVGVGPVQTKNTDVGGGTITFLTLGAATCNIAVTPGVNGAPAIPLPGGAPGALVPATGCTATYTTNAFTEMGTSDIEANKFFGINEPVVDGVGLPFRTQGDRGFADERSLAALVFNHPVTLALFTRLQEVQFPLSSVCHPSNVGYSTIIAVPGSVRTDVTNGESEACMPSLTKSEINSMLTGRLVTWNQLLDSSGAAILPALPVQICRRVAGSGTQATINALTSNWPCDPNRTDGTTDIVNPRNLASGQVVLNSGSTDVDNCLNTFNGTGNPYAIGNLSVEGRNVDKLRAWRFIKIDGVAPTLRNVHAGDYTLWTQQACQRRNNLLSYNAPLTADDTIANKTLVFNSLCGDAAVNGLNGVATLVKLNNPTATCAAAPASCGSLYTWGQSGWLATATSAQVYDNVLAASTRPINAYTREVTTGRVNVCQTPVKSTVGGNAGRGTIVAPNPTWAP